MAPTMAIDFYQVDSFTSVRFRGAPAGVCIMEPGAEWPKDGSMLNIAKENNLAETAFCVKREATVSESADAFYDIRWFTCEIEMDLCGHATLAAAHVIFNYYEPGAKTTVLKSELSGHLRIARVGDNCYMMNLPKRMPEPVTLPKIIREGMGGPEPLEVLKSRDYVLVYRSEAEVAELRPNEAILNQVNLDPGGIAVTARKSLSSENGEEEAECDFVSRFFTPQCNIFEDPVTGSSFCSLAPYWAQKLDKKHLRAKQISWRVGEASCEVRDDAVVVTGEAVTYLKGVIYVDQM